MAEADAAQRAEESGEAYEAGDSEVSRVCLWRSVFVLVRERSSVQESFVRYLLFTILRVPVCSSRRRHCR